MATRVVAATTAVTGGRGNAPVEKTPHLERVVAINRVAKVVKGGRRFSFTALVIVGDGDGTVGVGYGKAKEVPAAIAKGVEEAKKHFFKVPRIGQSIPHPVHGRGRRRRGAAQAGQRRYRRHRRWPGACRAGVRGHPRRALQEPRLVEPDQHRARHGGGAEEAGVARRQVAARRGLPVEDVAPAAMLAARAGVACLMARLKVTQLRSEIGTKQNQRESLRSLGLKRINDVVVKEDRPEIRGMIFTVSHLVKVEEVE